MTKTIVRLLVILTIGLVILAWPEEESLMMVQLSENHGPSKLDLLGIALIMIGYIPMVIHVIKRTSDLRIAMGKWFLLSIVMIAISFASITLALYANIEWLLWVAVAVATGFQSVIVYLAYCSNGTSRMW